MSRAFLRDDAEGEMPRRNYALPEAKAAEIKNLPLDLLHRTIGKS